MVERSTETKHPLSAQALIENKNPSLAARLPSFCYRLLDRIAHTRKLNRYITKTADLPARDALTSALRRLRISCRVRTAFATANPISRNGDRCLNDADIETVFPGDARITVVANHPLGGADALVLLDLLTRRYGKAVVLANDLMQTVTPLAPFFAPVNKHGSNLAHFQHIDTLFQSETPILVFPAGRTGRPPAGRILSDEIVDFPWAKTFVTKSRVHQRLIVPVHVCGRNSRLFYCIAWLRTRLSIRINLEMLLLVDELIRRRGATLDLVVGAPIDAGRLDRVRSDHRWAQTIRRYVQALGDGRNGDFFAWMDQRTSSSRPSSVTVTATPLTEGIEIHE